MRQLLLAAAATGAACGYTPDHTCAIMDKYECVNSSACGWCEAHYTCMRGNESGPLPGSLPCPDGNLFVPYKANMRGLANASRWSWTKEDIVEIYRATHKKVGKPLKPTAQYGQTSAPPEWAPTPCINGGVRHWEKCLLDSSDPSQCASGQDPKDQFWGAEYCDCPEGLGGVDCGSCTASAGCLNPLLGLGDAPVNETWSCNHPLPTNLYPGPDIDTHMMCRVEEVYPQSEWAKIEDFAKNVSVEFKVSRNSDGFISIWKPVEHPAWAGEHYKGDESGQLHVDRFLSGIAMRMKIPSTLYDVSPQKSCPGRPDKGLVPPWKLGDQCIQWAVNADPDTYGECPTMNKTGCPGIFKSGCYREYSYVRYEDCETLEGLFQPPTKFECKSANGDGTDPADLNGKMGCILDIHGYMDAQFKLSCQVNGVCNTTELPPTPPGPGPVLPWCQQLLRLPRNNYEAGCHTFFTYLRLFVPLVVALAIPALIKLCFCVHAKCGTTRAVKRVGPTEELGASLLRSDRQAQAAADRGPLSPIATRALNAAAAAAAAGNADADDDAVVSARLRPLLALRMGLQSKHADCVAQAVQLSWRDLSYSIKRAQVLQPCSGGFSRGMWCMLGPSGAGKSTLLGVLAGRKRVGTLSGEVLLNGQSSTADVRQQRVGYVTQDDVLPPASTVREHFAFHAATRATWLPARARKELVDCTMRALQLQAKANCLIGDAYMRGLSGGERRRVSIGAELLVAIAGGCSLLLADEPLSGLDSYNAGLVLEALSQLSGAMAAANEIAAAASPRSPQLPVDTADVSLTPKHSCNGRAIGSAPSRGTRLFGDCWPQRAGGTCAGADVSSASLPLRPTVLLSIHQPTHACLKLMSGYVVMAPAGRLVYCGPRIRNGGCALTAAFDNAAGGAFSLASISPNVAEALLEVMADPSEKVQQSLERLERQAAEGTHDLSERSALTIAQGKGHLPGIVQQFIALSSRHATLALRHPLLVSVNLVATLSISLLCGAAFWQMGSKAGGDESKADENCADGSCIDFDKGVLQRVGLLFFLGIFFLLTALADLPMWQHERLLLFQERGAGCYSTLPYIVSKTLFQAMPLRVIPSILCAAIVYPMVGLRHDSLGPECASMFVAGLTLLNVAGSTTFNCLGIACQSGSVATLLGVLLALFTMLFCGLLVNGPALHDHGLQWLQKTSFLYYFIEIVLVNELEGETVLITPRTAELKKTTKPTDVPGDEVLAQLGYTTHREDGYRDLDVLGAWVAGALVASYLLLRFYIRDPH